MKISKLVTKPFQEPQPKAILENVKAIIHDLTHVSSKFITLRRSSSEFQIFPGPVLNLVNCIHYFSNEGLPNTIKSIYPELAQLVANWQNIFSQDEQHWNEESLQNLLVDLKRSIISLQRRLRTVEYMRRKNRMARNRTNQYKRVISLFHETFNQTSKLLICRTDLHYHNSKSHQYRELISNSLGGEQAVRDRDNLLRSLAPIFGKNLIGYAWKLEHGTDRELHTHLLVILNGHNLSRDVWASQQIEKSWVKITEGDGYAINCNARFKHRYEHCVLGLITYDDEAAWIGINKIASYFAKIDLWVDIHLPPRIRRFGRSELIPERITKPGPKRSKETVNNLTKELKMIKYGPSIF